MPEYRVDADFDLIGGFWDYCDPKNIFTGSLSSRNGRVELTAAPTYRDIDHSEFRREMLALNGDLPQYRTLCGFTNEGPCTLLKAYSNKTEGVRNFKAGKIIAAPHYRSFRTVMGLHLESGDARSIDSAAFYFSKLRRWVPTPWQWRQEQDFTTYKVPHEAKEVFSFCSLYMRSEVRCEVFGAGGITFGKRAEIKTVPRITVTPETPQSVNWFNSLAFRLENFLTLFLGTSVGMKQVQLFQGDTFGWLVQETKSRNEKVNHQRWVRCPAHRLANVLANWLAVPEDKRPVETTLLGMMRKSTVFYETEFLSLAQALEGFSRIKFEIREESFDARIQRVVDLLSLDFASNLLIEPAKFKRKVVDTRNLYTHLGIQKGPNAIEGGKELFLLNQRLHALLRCVMLLDLGIAESELKDQIMYQATEWR